MRKLIITILSATLVLALFPAASASAAVVTPADDALIDCVVDYIPVVQEELRDTDWGWDPEWGPGPDFSNLPEFSVNQANSRALNEYVATQAELALIGAYPTQLTHETMNAAHPEAHSLYVRSGGMSGYHEMPDSGWICHDVASDIVHTLDELNREYPRLAAVRPLHVSFGVTTIEGDVAGWEEPGVIFTVMNAAQIWTPKRSGSEFLDTPVDHTFVGDVNALAASGVTKGCNPPHNTDFCPENFVTRGEMATFLTRALNLAPARPAFGDVTGPHWDDIGALAAAGITRGCNPPANDRFCADDYVTRGQMATFLVRAMNLPSAPNTFTDVAADNPHSADIGALADSGITKGCNPPVNDRFCADDFVTRGQMAAFLVRANLTN